MSRTIVWFPTNVKAPSHHVITSNMAAPRSLMVCLRSGMWNLLFYCLYCHFQMVLSDEVDSCENLHLGQYPLIHSTGR